MEINNPLISIIIPTFNRAHLIGETLDSVLVQTYSNWECIIVDDGSVDNTEEVVNEYIRKDSRFKFFHRPQEHKPGGNGARNYGFKMSSGAYVNWFDSDDLMHVDFLKSKIEPFLRDSNLDVVICKCKIFYKNNDKIIFDKEYSLISQNIIEDYICRKLNIQTASILWNSKKIENIFYDEDLTQSQDYDFISNFFSGGNLRINIIHQILLFIRKGEQSISLDFSNFNENHIYSFIKVKKKIIEKFSHNKKIVNTMANQLLSSLNISLQQKMSKNIILIYTKTFDELVMKELKAYRLKWFFLKYLTFFLFFARKGAYKLKFFYKF